MGVAAKAATRRRSDPWLSAQCRGHATLALVDGAHTWSSNGNHDCSRTGSTPAPGAASRSSYGTDQPTHIQGADARGTRRRALVRRRPRRPGWPRPRRHRHRKPEQSGRPLAALLQRPDPTAFIAASPNDRAGIRRIGVSPNRWTKTYDIMPEWHYLVHGDRDPLGGDPSRPERLRLTRSIEYLD